MASNHFPFLSYLISYEPLNMALRAHWQDPIGLETINTIVKTLIPTWTNGLHPVQLELVSTTLDGQYYSSTYSAANRLPGIRFPTANLRKLLRPSSFTAPTLHSSLPKLCCSFWTRTRSSSSSRLPSFFCKLSRTLPRRLLISPGSSSRKTCL